MSDNVNINATPDAPVNSMFLYRGQYEQPEPQGYQGPRVVARALVNPQGTVTAQAMAALEHAKTLHAKHLQDLGDERRHYSTEGYNKQVAAFASTEAAVAADLALQKSEQRTEESRARVGQVRKSISPDGDVASELRANRSWNSAVRVLDKAEDGKVAEAARQLLAKAEGVELGVLAKELGSYMESRGSSAEGWLDASIAEIVPELASANAELQRAEQALQIVKYNHGALTKAYGQGTMAAPFVSASGYDPDRA